MSAGQAERGSGTALTGAMALLLCAVMLLGVWAAGWIGSVHRGRAAADLAALAGAQAHVRSEEACPAARSTARANGATLVTCRVEGDRRDFQVLVEVRVLLRPVVGGVERHVVEESVAGSLPRQAVGTRSDPRTP